MSARGNIAGNPVLIGAATVLVILVAVFLSYNANQGLPFVPAYKLTAETPSAANLVRGNEVRIGGTRVGSVDSIGVERRDDGTSIAVLGLKLERSADPLPKDSTILIRPRSALGLKYVEITRGTSDEGWADGDTIPLAQATPDPVEFDDFTNMFDDATRDASQTNLKEFGDAFAGRGASINQAIGAFKPLLEDIIPVARNLSDPETGLTRLIVELSDAARIVAPAAETQAQLFVNLDATFGALREVARPYIQESISEGPATLDAAIESFEVQQPFLANTEALFRDLQPGTASLVSTAGSLADALEVGTPTLLRYPAFNDRLASLLEEVADFSENPLVPRGIKRLTETATSLKPTLAQLTPAQTTCNYLALWFRNVASLLSEGDNNGTWQRFMIVATPTGPNNEGGLASAPANGPTLDNHLHSNPYPNTASPGQPNECEAGNEPYIAGRTVIGNPPGTQQAATERESAR
ncbi:MAG TPA: MlaD family protein [Solirubrobacteraceae bacterium]|nr:MlaD family protein [Solirubrobacteraceae bacterium]